MPIHELEQMDLNMLAMYCLRVAESPESNYLEVEQARQFKTEWVLFIGHARPPIPELEKSKDLDAYEQYLKDRMVGFLAELPMRLTLSKQPASIDWLLRTRAAWAKWAEEVS